MYSSAHWTRCNSAGIPRQGRPLRTMTGRKINQVEDRLLLRSRPSDIAQIPMWIDSLASRHGIPENVEFAINLCLEEAISNIIRHGYGADMDGPVLVRFTMQQEDLFIFVIEDQARHFDPLGVPPPNPKGTVRV